MKVDGLTHHIIAYHGWGFSASFWNPIQNSLENNILFESADRGYFNNPVNPVFRSNGKIKNIVVTHSFGLHWCDNETLQLADHLVVLGGYLNFHPSDEEEYRRSKLTLRQMLSQFVEQPETVLKQFYTNSFYPQKNKFDVPDLINHDLLLSDLSMIDSDEHPHQRVFDFDSITILHGAEDVIVNKNVAREMYNALRFRSQYFEILHAGHAFPVTHSKKCLEILTALIKGE